VGGSWTVALAGLSMGHGAWVWVWMGMGLWILTQTKEAVCTVKDQTKKQIVSRLSFLPFFSVFVLWVC
jgi:hypothetical protein